MASKKTVFDKVYEDNLWHDADSRSGTGSNLVQTQVIRRKIPEIIKQYGIKTMLDVPCGDYFWMKEIKNELEKSLDLYVGADIVGELVQQNGTRYGNEKTQFRVLDVTKDELPKVDLVFSRDCFIHLSYKQIMAALRQFKKSGAVYLLTSTYTNDRLNKNTSDNYVNGRALNLELFPFHFPKPLLIVNEGCTEGGGEYADKSLGLWKLNAISVFRIKMNLWLHHRFPVLRKWIAG
jgi:hypothetical protein